MNKSEIRKKLIKFRMLKSHKNLEIDFAAILKRLRKKKNIWKGYRWILSIQL